jgi:GNAT superfamily N-acetyltransferase
LNLRPVNASEFEVVFDIINENAKWLLLQNIIQWPLNWLESKRQEIKESIELGMYYAIDIDDEIAAIVEIKSDPEAIWKNDLSLAFYIHKLAVRRKYANQKLGGIILKLIEKYAVQGGAKSLRLDCIATNTKLRQYYELHGFRNKFIVNVGDVDLALYEFKLEI